MKVKNENKIQWRLIQEHVGSARELVIEGLRADIYKVGYEKVQILYLKEILRIELDPENKQKFFR